MTVMLRWTFLFGVWGAYVLQGLTQTPEVTWDFKEQEQRYFQDQVKRIEAKNDLLGWHTPTEFSQLQSQWRQELWEMLGLWPQPAKSPLKAKITGITEYEDFVIEKVVFESLPGLYVTATVYRPHRILHPLPAIIYVCGHATVVQDGYNYGSKAHYQHHPAWYARHGYVCIILDTLQLGEIEGIHHGLYRYNRWWWIARGYTPAGVEAWNGIRALDYLLSRPDVDPQRLGVTGRSGGGATSWWIGALDERVKVVVPVAGITDLHNHVIDHCVEGHCDCMYYNNLYQWDFPKLGALIAPRPLLIANADSDEIFPLDGVYRTYTTLKKLYQKLHVADKIALNIVGGGHHDVQEIQVHTFRWFNHNLYQTDTLLDLQTPKYLEAKTLRVLDRRPTDEINTRIDGSFVPAAPGVLEQITTLGYARAKQNWLAALKEKVFHTWPQDQFTPRLTRLVVSQTQEVILELFQLQTNEQMVMPVLVLRALNNQQYSGDLYLLDDKNWNTWHPFFSPFLHGNFHFPPGQNPLDLEFIRKSVLRAGAIVFIPMRNAGPMHTTGDSVQMTHLKRHYYLLGQTLESVQTYDLVQGIKMLQQHFPGKFKHIKCAGITGAMILAALQGNAGYRVEWNDPVLTFAQGPIYPNILKYLDTPAMLALGAENNTIVLSGVKDEDISKIAGSLKKLVPELNLEVR